VAPRTLGPRSARLALETLGVSEREADARRARARAMARWVEAQGSADLRVPRVQDGSEPGGLRLPVSASPEVRGRLLERGRAVGIMPGYPLPLPELPPLKPHIAESRCFPGAEALAERLVTLPTHSLLRDSDMSLIAVLLRDADG
jgi:dTDP-4-amino-4,6-dideoxygalactose transaminase